MKDAQTRADLRPKGLRQWLAPRWTPANGRRAALILAFAIAYALISRHQTLPPALDPAGALLLASCLLLPPRRWWPYLLVATAVQVWILASLGLPALTVPLTWAATLSEPIVIVYLMRRANLFGTSPTRIANMRVVTLYATCVFVGATISASLAAIGLSAAGRPFGASWWSWFFSVCLNALVLAPAIVLWAMRDYRR
ncbi:MAG TPA: hypothetical protein VFW76_02020, partial [Ktedonobacterales bacterium]|nr:hypothetical protein [Ktedonobacterales bacterium]